MGLQDSADMQMLLDDFARQIYLSWRKDRVNTEMIILEKSRRIVVEIITVDDEIDYNWRGIIAEWVGTERFRWALDHSVRPIEIHTQLLLTSCERQYALTAQVSELSYTEWLLKYT